MRITNQLDKLMAMKGIRKSDLARESGVPYTTIQGLYTKGDENIKLSTMIKFADYFGVSLDYLADYNQNITSEPVWSPEESREIANFKAYLLSKRSTKLNIKGGSLWDGQKGVEEEAYTAIETVGEDKYR